jgi:uncharacterized delta-60 repeat protein
MRARRKAWGLVRAVPPIILALAIVALQSAANASPGDLDPTFGTGGMAIAGCDVWDDDYFGCDGGYGGRLYDVVLQADGRIVAVGASEGSDYRPQFRLVRQLDDGTADASLGGSGTVTTTFAAPSAAYAVTLQADGKIVAAGTAGRRLYPESFYSEGTPGNSFAIARYHADGSADSTFGGDGSLRTRFGPRMTAAAYAVAIQSDGKAVAVGSAGAAFGLVRYGSDGSLDPAFGSDGRVRTRFLDEQTRASASDIAILDDGALLVFGSTCSGNRCSLVLARYLPDGTLDSSFGVDGAVFAPVRLTAYPAHYLVDGTVLADGRIVAGAGRTIFRFEADGSLDTSFSEDGWIPATMTAAGIGVLSDGSILVTGATKWEPWSFLLARFDPAGDLDAEFGDDGWASAEFPGFDNVGYALTIQEDGRIVVVGTTSDVNIDGRFALARFLAS